MRIACLLIPDLPLRAELRAHPELVGKPTAIATGPDARAEILSCSPEAAALGLRTPCSVSHARSLSSQIVVRVASPVLEHTTREALLDVALSVSPRAALAPRSPGVFVCEAAVFLDASGVASLYHSEAGFAAALGARAEAVGLPGHIAIASSRSIAKIVARKLSIPMFARALSSETQHQDGPLGKESPPETGCCVLSPSEEAKTLAPLPIDLLDPGDDLAHKLTRFGVQSVRDLLALPRRALAQRLGEDVLHLIARAEGRKVEAPLPEPRDTRLREAMDLDYSIELLEPLAFVLRGMLSRLAERLALRGLASGPIDLGLQLCGGGRDHRRIGVAAPTRDHRVLLRLVVGSLEGRPPEAPIDSVALSTEGVAPRRDQLDLFRAPGPDPAETDRTLAELESLCGPGQVGAPAIVNDNHPCAYELKPFSGNATGASRIEARPGRCHLERSNAVGQQTTHQNYDQELGVPLVVRALRPPVRAEVQLHQGQPCSIQCSAARGRILNAAGPWRTTGRWWSSEEHFALDHFDVQVSDGTILRLCFDWIARSWQVDAIYD